MSGSTLQLENKQLEIFKHFATYSARTVRDICSSPSNSKGMLDRFCWNVRAGIDAIRLAPRLNINRISIGILKKGKASLRSIKAAKMNSVLTLAVHIQSCKGWQIHSLT